MQAEIGETAGLIWRALKEKGGVSLGGLKALLNINERLFCMGIGWLAKEDKIDFRRGKKKNECVVFLK